MKKITLLRGPAVRISYDADDWRLYNGETLEQDQERDMTAEALNEGLQEILARSPTRKDVSWAEIDHLLYQFRFWGAADTDVRRVVNSIVDNVYPAD